MAKRSNGSSKAQARLKASDLARPTDPWKWFGMHTDSAKKEYQGLILRDFVRVEDAACIRYPCRPSEFGSADSEDAGRAKARVTGIREGGKGRMERDSIDVVAGQEPQVGRCRENDRRGREGDRDEDIGGAATRGAADDRRAGGEGRRAGGQ